MAEKKFKKNPFKKKVDPDEAWNTPAPDFNDAVLKASGILAKLKTAPGKAWDKNFKFLTDIEKKVTEVSENIRGRRAVSEGQARALDGWEAAIDRIIKEFTTEGQP